MGDLFGAPDPAGGHARQQLVCDVRRHVRLDDARRHGVARDPLARHLARDATFEDLDVDSLDLAELSQIIEDEYGVQLKGDDVGKIKTVGDAIDLVVSRAG